VEDEALVPVEPSAHPRMLVGGVIIEDDVHGFPVRAPVARRSGLEPGQRLADRRDPSERIVGVLANREWMASCVRISCPIGARIAEHNGVIGAPQASRSTLQLHASINSSCER